MTAAAGTIEREVAKIVADVLAEEMGLDDGHCLLGDQPWDIPTDHKLFAVVFDQVGKPFGAATFLDPDQDSSTFGMEVQQFSVLHDVRVEVMSFGGEARVRALEVGLALGSLFAQQQEGRYRLQIGRAQEAVNASETENTARLQKFVVHVNVTALHQKVKVPPKADYFNKFNGATVDGTIAAPQVTDQP